MRETRLTSWLAGLGVLGGVAIALGIPYLTLVHGDELSVTARLLVIVLSLAAGGAIVRAGQSAVESDVVGQNRTRSIL